MLYVISMACQLSGAIILLLNSLTKLEKQIIAQYSGGEAFTELKDGMAILSSKRIKDITMSVSLNRAAFLDLVLGYGTAVAAESCFPVCKTLILMTILTLGITSLEWVIAFLTAKIISVEGIKVPATELKDQMYYEEIKDKEENSNS